MNEDVKEKSEGMLAILDYDAGNIESVRLALRHVGGDPEIVSDARVARRADRIVFPGVGAAGQCMKNLRARGFDKVLEEAVAGAKPVLAICIGMQLLFDGSDEDGGVDGLGLLPGRVVRFVPDGPLTKIPHMGWNHVDTPVPHPLLPEALPGGDFYFVHSYYARPAAPEGREPAVVYGLAEYSGVRFTAMAGRGSLFATQFHPEKSGETGLDILRRFVRWDGREC